MLAFDNFIQRQTASVNAQSARLQQLSTEMQLAHPRGRFKYHQMKLDQLHWLLFICKLNQVTSYFPGTVSRLKVREKVLKKSIQNCKDEMNRARLELIT